MVFFNLGINVSSVFLSSRTFRFWYLCCLIFQASEKNFGFEFHFCEFWTYLPWNCSCKFGVSTDHFDINKEFSKKHGVLLSSSIRISSSFFLSFFVAISITVCKGRKWAFIDCKWVIAC